MQERLLKNLKGEFKPSVYAGTNESGVMPMGKRILVLMDEFSSVTSGNIHIPEAMVERMNMAGESGVLIEAAPEAFSTHPDHTKWTGRKPVPGDRLYLEKYAGVLVQGIDSKVYRLMEDSCASGIYQVIETED